MTFSKQLYALILLTSLLMAVGTLYINIKNTRSYLSMQLAVQTQNAADSLGLSLVPHMQNNDMAAMETMVNAVFDSGYYKSLSLTNMSGASLIERENTSQVEDVPEWFIHALKLKPAEAESIITTGWIQAGKLTLSAHPGFAYKKLWDASKEVLWWSLMVFMLTLSLSFVLLREILKPLSSVEKQALDICNREFPIVQKIPKTRELKRVVLAMNQMSARMEKIISDLSNRANRIQKQSDFDPLTGLINRSRFSGILASTIKNKEQAGSGYVAVVRLGEADQYNKLHGHDAGDELFSNIARLLEEQCQNIPSAIVARISGVDFAILLPLIDRNTTARLAKSLSSELASLCVEPIRVHLGIAPFNETSSVKQALNDADVALASAQYQGIPNFHILASATNVIDTFDWEQLVPELIRKEQIKLWTQAISTPDSQLIYSEILMRIHDTSGSSISPGSFAAMTERMGLNIELDKYVIQHVIDFIEQQEQLPAPLAVNISVGSIKETSFTLWLQQQLKSHPEASKSLIFEITEYAAMQNIENTGYLIDLVHHYHGRIVIEHFGTQTEVLQSLRQLKADFIKLDGSYVKDIVANKERHAFLQMVIDIAHSLDIGTIIEHIETEEDVHNFESLGIGAMQGFYFGKPTSIDLYKNS